MPTVDNRYIEKILNTCDSKIKKWEKTFGHVVNKQDNAYISTLEAIKLYLQAYLNKDNSNAFDQLLINGYQKFDNFSTWDYIPTLELCKQDLLHEADLALVEKIANLSMFLSNKEFNQKANDVLFERKAPTQWGFENARITDEVCRIFPSNGFQYYVAGKLCEFNHNWENSFSNHETPQRIHDSMFGVGFVLFSATLYCLYNKDFLASIAFSLVNSSLMKASEVISDKIAITFFSKPNNERRDQAEQQHHNRQPKQHITPEHCISAWKM